MRRRQTFLASEEGTVFAIGSTLLILFLCTVALLWRLEHAAWNDLVELAFTQLVVGRAGAVVLGTQRDYHPAMVTAVAVYVDVVTMFIAYPVLVYWYRHLVERPILKRRVQMVFDAARQNVHRVARYRAIGVFFFVWIPLAMTGVVVGSILGYLLGLRTWITLLSATLGTAAATLSWLYAYNIIFAWLAGIHPLIPAVGTLGILAALALLRLRKSKPRTPPIPAAPDSDDRLNPARPSSSREEPRSSV